MMRYSRFRDPTVAVDIQSCNLPTRPMTELYQVSRRC